MKIAQGTVGRVFVLRLEDGDRLPDALEDFAREQGVSRALVTLLGGAGPGTVVVGPKDGAAAVVEPMLRALEGVHEIAAVGTLFPDEDGAPKLHMHGALGRGDTALAGCVRKGVGIWRLGEVVVLELTGLDLVRRLDPAFGFEVLDSP
jgi:predicted DNA-binding protein with PD1-like motif